MYEIVPTSIVRGQKLDMQHSIHNTDKIMIIYSHHAAYHLCLCMSEYLCVCSYMYGYVRVRLHVCVCARAYMCVHAQIDNTCMSVVLILVRYFILSFVLVPGTDYLIMG